MDRIMVFDRLDRYLCDLDPELVREAPYIEAVNGEHSLTVVTTQTLEKTNRLLMCDGMGVWHEYVVLGIKETHDAVEYYCIWSLQYDLDGTFVNGPYDCGVVPGHASIPQLPHRALEVALSSTSRWEIGTITATAMAAASFYRRSGWEALQTVIENWGGELQATITVGQTGVISRAVDLLERVGTSNATRRFDYGFDLKGIKRTVSDDIWPCRIVPLGKAQETENGGYTRRPSIASVNEDCMWLQDDSVVEDVRILNPDGEYEYPTLIVENDTYEDPADLKAWALEHITEYTRPKVSYEAEVVQFERAGLNAHGVTLGDNIVVVDRTFRSGALRIDARVTKITGSLLDPTDTKLTIGNIETITNQFAGLSRSVSQLTNVVDRSQQFQATASYLSHLLGRINTEINVTGGYVYITEGEGIRTYSVPVSDPLDGAEAKAAVATGNGAVVEIKGGTIRIANSLTQAGDWDWKTVFTSGHIAAELVTAARIVAGYIGNVAGSYWDLDNNVLHIATGAQLGNKTVSDLLSDVEDARTDASEAKQDVSDARRFATDYLTFASGVGLDVGYSATQAKTRITASGMEVFDGAGKSAIAITNGGNGAEERIGEANKSHAIIDYHSMQLVDKEGYTYFNVSDLRQTSGSKFIADVRDRFVADGSTTVFNLSFSAAPWHQASSLYNEDATVTVDGSEVTSGWTLSSTYVRFNTAPSADSVIIVEYKTTSRLAKAYTLGLRDTSGYVGAFSTAEGYNVEAAGNYSHAEGYGTTASGNFAHAEGRATTASGIRSHAEGYSAAARGETSHAEGQATVASGIRSHAEGWSCTASGANSHAQGQNTIAASANQTVLGKYNVEDTHDTYALIIGNGTSSARQNMLAMNWNGALSVYGSDGYVNLSSNGHTIRVYNNKAGVERNISLQVSDAGNGGVYDHTDSAWIVRRSAAGETYIGSLKMPYICSGRVGQTHTVQSNSFTDVNVTFGHTYPSEPDVVVGFYSTSNTFGAGNLSIAVTSVSTIGFTARIYNASTSARSPGFYWIAIGEM